MKVNILRGAATSHTSTTGVGVDGFDLKVLLDLSDEMCEKILTYLLEVEMAGSGCPRARISLEDGTPVISVLIPAHLTEQSHDLRPNMPSLSRPFALISFCLTFCEPIGLVHLCLCTNTENFCELRTT